MAKEIYVPIKGYEGRYDVSNFGNVKSIKTYTRNGKKIGETKEFILKKNISSVGYAIVTLCKNREYKKYSIHRLVALAFIKNHQNKPQVNHIDGNKTNNNVNNLEWCTPSENGCHAYRELGIKNAFLGKYGKHHSKSKPVIQITKDGDMIRWDCAADAVRMHGFDSGAISKCCSGTLKAHKGYRWEYA